MARPLRMDQENTFYHVLHRGNERRAIFRDDADREGFLARLGRCAERFSLHVYAYVLMGNHYHLLVRTAAAVRAVRPRRAPVSGGGRPVRRACG